MLECFALLVVDFIILLPWACGIYKINRLFENEKINLKPNTPMFRNNWALIILKTIENLTMSANYVLVITTPKTLFANFWAFAMVECIVSFLADSAILYIIF
jgi:hypothetical protein